MNYLKTLLIFALTISLFSCKKDVDLSHDLVGEWELRQSINGQTGNPTNYPAGNGKILKFTATNYEIWDSGAKTTDGSYRIEKYTSYLTKKEERRIVYDGQTNTVISYFKIEGDSLSIMVDANDGPSTLYARIK